MNGILNYKGSCDKLPVTGSWGDVWFVGGMNYAYDGDKWQVLDDISTKEEPKPCTCEKCGATVEPYSLVCEYCGTIYRW